MRIIDTTIQNCRKSIIWDLERIRSISSEILDHQDTLDTEETLTELSDHFASLRNLVESVELSCSLLSIKQFERKQAQQKEGQA